MKHWQHMREHIVVWGIFTLTILALCISGCASTEVGGFLTNTLHLDGLAQFIWGVLAALAIGLFAGVTPLTAILIGLGSVAATKATEPAPPPSTVVNNNGKGAVNLNGTDLPAGFLGMSTFQWGLIVGLSLAFLVRNRAHVLDLVRGRVAKGERLSTILRMFFGGSSTPPPAAA